MSIFIVKIFIVIGGIFSKISSTLQSYIIWLKSALLEVEALIRGSKIGFCDPASHHPFEPLSRHPA